MSQPAFHALCNGTAFVLLLTGWAAIAGRGPWRGRASTRAHVASMLAALVASTVFLASYLHYHQRVGSVPFPIEGAPRTAYLVVLVPHVVLAAVQVPLIVATVVAAARRRWRTHRRLARITMPVWLYVSVSGVAVYWMLYVWAGAVPV